MASDGHSTICDVDKVNDEPEGEAAEDPENFPEGGPRAWMTLVGRFDYMSRAVTGSDVGLQFPFSVCWLWVRLRR
jgi:hypothetical protein